MSQIFSKNVKHDVCLSRIPTILTLEEEKVLYLIFSKIDPFRKNPLIVKVEKSIFFEKLGLESENRYSRYKKILIGLINKTYIEIKDIEERFWHIWVVITNVKWNDSKSYFEVELNKSFMPFLENFSKYTKISLSEICNLNSKYSLTLYKWLRSWTDKNQDLNERYEKLETFKELFASKDKYLVFKDFEKRILNPSLKEINNSTGLKVNIKKIKENGQITKLQFSWLDSYNENFVEHKLQIIKTQLSKRIGKTVTSAEAIDKWFYS